METIQSCSGFQTLEPIVQVALIIAVAAVVITIVRRII